MSTRGNSRGIIAAAVLALLVLVAIVPTTWGATKSFPEEPTVTAAGRTIERADLSAAAPPRLSGLANNEVVVTYTGQAEILQCQGSKLRYTVDGTNPTSSSPSINTDPAAPTSGSSCSAPAGAGIEYHFILVPGNFTNATENAMVTFRLEIARSPGTPQIDNNGGLFYKYRIDRTRGHFTTKAPANVTGSSLGDVSVTSLSTPPVSFVLIDEDAEAPINQSSVSILVDNVDRTSAFNCAFASFSVTCALDYGDMPPSFTFNEGSHTIQVVGADAANNQFDATNSTIRLRVDKTGPVVRNVTATPNQQGGTSGGLPIVSRGGNVTVKVNVEDINVNRNALDTARAFLFNATNSGIPLSQGFGLRFNATSGKFEGNATVPTSWPEQALGVNVRVEGRDQAGNVGLNNTTGPAFIVDPILPSIVESSPPGPSIKDTPTRTSARITDQGSGLDPNQVKIIYSNLTGSFKNIPATSSKVGTSNNTFEAKMNRIGTSDNYTYDIPAANPGTTVTYKITAKDKAGGPAETVLRTLTVDIDGPVVQEVDRRAFRAATPYTFEFEISDAGAGVNTTGGKLFYTTGATFQSANLIQDVGTGAYFAIISPTVTDGQTLKYYVEAKDLLGNVGRNGTSSSPRTSVIDLVAPTITKITSPATASAATFLVEWDGSDSRSGVANFTVEARVNDGTPSIWIPILKGTTDKSIAFCGEGGHKYEFRVAATDVAGNTGTMPTTPQTSTQLNGEGCAEQVLVSIIAPVGGQQIDGTNGVFNLRFSASSTRTFTPSSELRVDVLFSPDGAFWHTVETGVRNTGSYELDLTDLPNCSACRIRIVAKTLTGASDDETSGSFSLRNADAEADLDGNGLPDSWETLYAGTVGTLKADGDNDGDGLSNVDESRLGTDPDNRDTDGDGASDRAESRAGTDALSALDTPTLVQSREDEYTNWYWTVPGLFLATTILFFVGLARRW